MPLNLGSHAETQRHTRQRTWKRLGIVAAFAVLLILLVVNTFVLRHELTIQAGNEHRVIRTQQALLALESTQSLIVDAETGQRGYLFTGDPKYLESYELAIGQFEGHIDNLAQLTADDSRQQAQIPVLRSLAQAKLAELGQTISLFNSTHPDEAKAMVMSDAGLVAMNKIRTLVADMELEEVSLEASRAIVLQRSIFIVFVCIYLASFLGALSLVFLAHFILKEMNVRQKHLREIQRREEWYRVTLTSIGDAVICADYKGTITFLNLLAEEMTGWPLSEAIGQPIGEVIQIVDATNRKNVVNPMVEAFRQNRTEHLPANCILLRRDEHEIFIEDSASPIHDYDGKIIGSVIVFRDVSTTRAFAERTVHASQHDALTGLPNRLLLNDRVGQAIALARRNQGQVAMLFLDLDGFKHINDSLGHLIGDKLLKSVATRLEGSTRTPDTVSRQGGDEFIVVLQGIQNREDAAIAAKRVLEDVSKPHIIDQHILHVTASVGMSMYPDDGLNAETLLKNADTAMYHAKENGRQCYEFFTPDMNAQAVERQSIEQDLRHAVDRNEFTLHYQPKINLKTGAITGAEALLRWTNHDRGSVPPANFLQIAEDSGIILPIGMWVMREACTQAKAWIDQGLPITNMAINVSAVQFLRESFVQDIAATLSDAGLDPGCLELELTESVLMHQPELAASILQTLRNKRVVMTLDDFGTGYSSLSYLKKLPLDALKIDRSFVHQLSENPDIAAIAIAIVSMGQSLNLRVIAEGVETAEELAFLLEHDCTEAQGFYFSRPLPAEQFAQLLSQPSFFLTPQST